MPSCSQFEPNVSSPASNQEAWLSQWKTNFLSDTCVQKCASVCVAHTFSADCRSCLVTADCTDEANCLSCIGADGSYQNVYNCTVSPVLTSWEIACIVIGSVLVAFLFSVLVIYILYRNHMLPLKTRLEIKSLGKELHWKKN